MLENTIKEEENRELQELQHHFDQYIPQLSIDCVIFGFHNNYFKSIVIKI